MGEMVQAVDVCTSLKHANVFPVHGPSIVAGMLTVLATDSRDRLPRRLTLPGPFGRSRMGCWYASLPIEWPFGVESPLRMFEGDACLGSHAASTHDDLPNFCVANGRYEHREA